MFCSLGALAALEAACHPRVFGEDSPRSFAEKLEDIRSKHSLPGLMAGHFDADGGLELEAVGVRRADGKDPIAVDDLMHLGSCTKSMTATVIGILVDEGKLSFDTRLGDVFRDDSIVQESPWKDATIDQLLRHVSGAVANPPWGEFASTSIPIVEIRRNLLHWLMERRRNEEKVGTFLYSNLGYAVAGHVLEQIENQSWEEIIRKRLFEPLGMLSAGFGIPSQRRPEGAPVGHSRVLGWTYVQDEDNPPSLGPAGTVHATMEDWAKYLRVHLVSDPAGEGRLPLSKQTLERLQTPLEGATYAAGWVCGERDWAGGRILMHNGSNTHWYCVTFLAPLQRRGIFAASNLGLNAAQPCDLALQAILKSHGAK